MTRRIFTGALSEEIADAEGRARDRDRVALLNQTAKGMLALIRDGLIRDGAVRLHRFGTFRLKPVAARRGINPRTGEPLVVPAHRRVVFTPAKALLDRIEPLHPAPRPLPESVAPKRTAPAVAVRPTTPPPKISPPAPPVTPDVAAPESPPEVRNPATRWLAAAALLAAIAVLALWQWPVPQQASPPAVATREPTSPAAPHSAQPATMSTVTPPPPAATQPAVASSPKPTEIPTPIETPEPAPNPATAETVNKAPPAAAPATSPAAPAPYFAERSYTVADGDNLWRLSARHYHEAILWPHIYRANHDRVTDPDLIYQGDELTLPELQGPPDALSAQDRERIAEGYFLVYQRYEAEHRPDAIYALIGARWFDPAVYERHRPDLSHQRLRIMELSPLYGDGVPRLLAATFNPVK